MEKTNKPGRVIVACGPPLTGKSTLARRVAEKIGVVIVDVDAERFRLLPFSDDLLERDPVGERELMIAAYEIAVAKCRFAAAVLHRDVVVSGPFSVGEFKRPMECLIEDNIVPVQIFRLDAPDEEIRRRIQERIDSGPETTIKSWDKYQWALSIRTPWPRGIAEQVKRIITTANPEEGLQAILAEIDTSFLGC